jgi:hypothetical protein
MQPSEKISYYDDAMAVFRIGICFSIIWQTVELAPYFELIFAEGGLLQKPIMQAAAINYVPTISDIAALANRVGVKPSYTYGALMFMLISSTAFLLLGLGGRTAAIFSWLLNAVMTSSSSLYVYGVGSFQHMGLFYCIIFPVWRGINFFGNKSDNQKAIFDNRTGVFVLQCHMCIVYLFAGISKASGEQWWNGEAMWRALMQPQFQSQLVELAGIETIAKLSPILMALGISVVVSQILFPIMVILHQTRLIAVIWAFMFHIGIAIFLGLYIFSFTMIVFDVAAFYGSHTAYLMRKLKLKALMHCD